MTQPPFSTTMTPTVSDAVRSQYLARYQQFERRFAEETGRDDLTPDEIVANLILLKPTVTMDSWRTYKNATLYALRSLYPSHESAIEALTKESSAELAKTSSNTSGRKMKHVTDEAFKALKKGMAKRIAEGHKHAKGLAAFLDASFSTGLRPVEWCFSSEGVHEETGREILRVRNAKHTNGRANGEYREIFIDELVSYEREAIRATLLYCKADDDDGAEKIITALRNELGIVRSSAIVTAKRPQSSVTLYSFRHQFIANAKATFEEPVLISAMVGHNSTKTAFEHYGKRRFSSTKVRVSPTPESVEAVQKITLETYRSLVAERAASRPFTL